jgi:hypothetical protein
MMRIVQNIHQIQKNIPISFSHRVPDVENEQLLIDNDKCINNFSSVALTTHTHPARNPNAPIWGNWNCKCPGHTNEFCVAKGGVKVIFSRGGNPSGMWGFSEG